MDNENSPDQPAPDQPAPEQPAPSAPPVVRWRDRMFRFRAVLAVALASIVLGAGVGVLGTLVFDRDHDHASRLERFDREGPGERGNFPRPGGPGGQNMPPQGSDELPPGTAPQQEESEPSAQDDATSSS